ALTLAGGRAHRGVEGAAVGAVGLARAEPERDAVDPVEVPAVALFAALDHAVATELVDAGGGVEAAARAACQLPGHEAERDAVHPVELAAVAVFTGIDDSVPAGRALLVAGRALVFALAVGRGI